MGLYLKCTIQDITCDILEGNKSSVKLNNIYFKRKMDISHLKTLSNKAVESLKQRKKIRAGV